jgi:hypothetical protein
MRFFDLVLSLQTLQLLMLIDHDDGERISHTNSETAPGSLTPSS